MQTAYVDTSVLLAMMDEETFTAWASEVLPRYEKVSSVLTEVELARYAHRKKLDLRLVEATVRGLSLIAVNPWVLGHAKLIAGEVKTLDAVQVATWLQLRDSGLNCPFITADRKQALAAQSVGAQVIHPF